jgi:hypothetical protein
MGEKLKLLPAFNQFLIVSAAAGGWGISDENMVGSAASAADQTCIRAGLVAKFFASALTFGPANESFPFREA